MLPVSKLAGRLALALILGAVLLIAVPFPTTQAQDDDGDVTGTPPSPQPQPLNTICAETIHGGEIRNNEMLGGSVTAYIPCVAYDLQAEAGEELLIDLMAVGPLGYDPYLVLTDVNLQILAEDDNSGLGADAQLIYEIPITGTYYLVATRTPAPEAPTNGLYVLRWDHADAQQRYRLLRHHHAGANAGGQDFAHRPGLRIQFRRPGGRKALVPDVAAFR